MTNYFLTGVTGVIGSQLLYELVQQKLDGEPVGKILLLVRPKESQNAHERVAHLFDPSLLPEELKKVNLEQIIDELIILDSDLNNIASVGNQIPESIQKFKVIHLAGSVNLSNTEGASSAIETTNYQSTMNLLKWVRPYCQKFCFISTAFSSGHRTGKITDEFLNNDNYEFRNPYEEYKLKTEKAIKEYSDANQIDYQILRPSVVCGRLIDEPLYVISKFLVFYLYGAFMYKISKNKLKNEELRIHISENAGLNIIPVDYVAKAILAATDKSIKQLNLVSSQSIPVTKVAETILRKTGLTNWKFVADLPKNLNVLEQLYYNTVGSQFNEYMNTENHQFETLELRKLLSNIPEPDVDFHFEKLFEYALLKRFKTVLD